jgi:hypothetical protein
MVLPVAVIEMRVIDGGGISGEVWFVATRGKLRDMNELSLGVIV